MRWIRAIAISGIIIFGISLEGYAQDTLWTKSYGLGHFHVIQPTADGGYIFAGMTMSPQTNMDFLVVKTTANGDSIWSHTYGGTDEDEAYSIQQTADGGYLVAGRSMSFGAGDNDFYLVRINSIGSVLWTRTYGGIGSEIPWGGQMTSDGGYIMAGGTTSYGAGNSDCYMVRTNSSGDTLWTRTYGGANFDITWAVQQTKDGGFILAGWTQSMGNGSDDVFLVKTNSAGTAVWTKTFGGAGSDIARSVDQTLDGGYIVAGYTYSLGAGLSDFYLVKTDSSGNGVWYKTFGGGARDEAWSVKETTDLGYLISGQTASFGAGMFDAYLVKTNSAGNSLWSRTYGGSSDELGFACRQTSDCGYFVAGYTDSYSVDPSTYLVKISDGPISTSLTIAMAPSSFPIIVNPGGSFTYTGYLTNNTSQPVTTDVWTKVNVPGFGSYGPLMLLNNVPVGAYQTLIAPGIVQSIPGFAPIGRYDYLAFCGDYPSIITDCAFLEFTVVNALAGSGNGWEAYPWFKDAAQDVPGQIQLMDNYPNPFNPTTTIKFELPLASDTRLEVFNLLGQRMATLVDSRMEAGYHEVEWDASHYSSGIYFYRLITGEKVFTKRMTLLK